MLNNYNNLLAEVRSHINETQNNITQIVTRKKVEMAWKIGQSIDSHLSQNIKKGYGTHLFNELEKDAGIKKSILYRMHKFYQTYPKLPQDDAKLNWSHYRILSGVKKDDERKYLEDLTKEKDLDAEALRQEIKKSKTPTPPKIKISKPLTPRRGKLFLYNLVKPEQLGKTCIDCGFGIFKTLEESSESSLKIVETVKENKKYSLKKSKVAPRKLNAYKAYLKRVVDGDTIRVILDLGFEIFHEEILRLRGINAAELDTAAGKKSATALKNILKNIPFLIIKTSATDMYGRYVADVFLAEEKGNLSAQEVADEGIYLNQLLLDKKLVTLFL